MRRLLRQRPPRPAHPGQRDYRGLRGRPRQGPSPSSWAPRRRTRSSSPSGGTEAINLVAAWSLGVSMGEPGDEIVRQPKWSTTPTSCPGISCVSGKGVVLKFDPEWLDDGSLDVERPDADLLGPRRRSLVALTHMSNVLGTMNPVVEPSLRWPPTRSAPCVLIDGCQGAVHCSARREGLSAATSTSSPATSCYGPTGIGALYGRAEVLEVHAALAGRGRNDRERSRPTG